MVIFAELVDRSRYRRAHELASRRSGSITLLAWTFFLVILNLLLQAS